MVKPLHHHRRQPTHGVVIQSTAPTLVLVTVCTKDRERWLATPHHHELLRAVWSDATAWRVGRYVLMPDHLHLFAAPGVSCVALDAWIRYWKSQFTKQTHAYAGRWQPNHWDRRLRQSESYDAAWEYVVHNPVRHGLVERAEDWAFQGEVNHMPW